MYLKVNEQIELRQIELQDAEIYWQLVNKNRSLIRKHFNWVDDFTQVEQSHSFIEKSILQIESLKGITWVILYNKTIIGSILLYNWQHDINKMTLGFWLDADQHKKGIMKACMHTVLNYAFDDIQVNKIDMLFSVNNENSRRLAEIFGFKLEGLLRKNYFLNGSLIDQYTAGLLRAEHQFNKSKN